MTKSSCIYLTWCVIFSAFHACTAESALQSKFNEAAEATLSEDGRLNFTQLVIKYGHTVEQYDVITEDGYILTIFRIPGPKPPVLLFHGITDSCDSFVIRGNFSLGITLAGKGYDVWFGNNRGNLYGRQHVTMNPDTDKEFWNYSFHQIGFYDLAAIIDFIIDETGTDSVSTISHSQGGSAHFSLLSLRPEYNEKIKVMIGLAPIAFLDDLGPPVSLVADVGAAIAAVARLAGIGEVLQNRKALSDLVKFICSKGILSAVICGTVTFSIVGFDPEGLEPEFLTGVAVGHYPRATSIQTLEHYDQIYLSHRFAQFDYGLGNFAKYGSVSPPEYDLIAVKTKVAIFVGRADAVSKVKDAEHLRSILPNVVRYEVIKRKQWNHCDFIWGKDMDKYLFPPILEVLEQYN